jgi:hypothetical protein
MSKWRAQVKVKWAGDPMSDEVSWSWIQNFKEIKWAASEHGEWNLTLWVDVNDPQELDDFINQRLKKNPKIVETHSTWVKQIWAA